MTQCKLTPASHILFIFILYSKFVAHFTTQSLPCSLSVSNLNNSLYLLAIHSPILLSLTILRPMIPASIIYNYHEDLLCFLSNFRSQTNTHSKTSSKIQDPNTFGSGFFLNVIRFMDIQYSAAPFGRKQNGQISAKSNICISILCTLLEMFCFRILNILTFEYRNA